MADELKRRLEKQRERVDAFEGESPSAALPSIEAIRRKLGTRRGSGVSAGDVATSQVGDVSDTRRASRSQSQTLVGTGESSVSEAKASVELQALVAQERSERAALQERLEVFAVRLEQAEGHLRAGGRGMLLNASDIQEQLESTMQGLRHVESQALAHQELLEQQERGRAVERQALKEHFQALVDEERGSRKAELGSLSERLDKFEAAQQAAARLEGGLGGGRITAQRGDWQEGQGGSGEVGRLDFLERFVKEADEALERRLEALEDQLADARLGDVVERRETDMSLGERLRAVEQHVAKVDIDSLWEELWERCDALELQKQESDAVLGERLKVLEQQAAAASPACPNSQIESLERLLRDTDAALKERARAVEKRLEDTERLMSRVRSDPAQLTWFTDFLKNVKLRDLFRHPKVTACLEELAAARKGETTRAVEEPVGVLDKRLKKQESRGSEFATLLMEQQERLKEIEAKLNRSLSEGASLETARERMGALEAVQAGQAEKLEGDIALLRAELRSLQSNGALAPHAVFTADHSNYWEGQLSDLRSRLEEVAQMALRCHDSPLPPLPSPPKTARTECSNAPEHKASATHAQHSPVDQLLEPPVEQVDVLARESTGRAIELRGSADKTGRKLAAGGEGISECRSEMASLSEQAVQEFRSELSTLREPLAERPETAQQRTEATATEENGSLARRPEAAQQRTEATATEEDGPPILSSFSLWRTDWW